MRRIAMLLIASIAALGSFVGIAGTPAYAAGHDLIVGSGSSWASNAVEQWRLDVSNNGLRVSFTPSGSAQGRKDFSNVSVDFAVSDIGFLGTDPATGADDTSKGRAYAYLPIVAGGTAMPYHILRNGQLVRNLRLSGQTVAKIFTNQITNWNDAAITADNNGVQMPNLPIIPVVHSEGSGSSYQFTRYLWKSYPSIYTPFGGNYATEYFNRQGNQVAENGSDSLMNFITSQAGNGSIGYDEYSYALNKNYPVVKLLNKAGYYTLPTQYNVAVALTQAQINTDKTSADYLLQNLDNVYGYSDNRTYPMSSYSYAIIPTASGSSDNMTSNKRQTLADYLYYSVCQGQKEIGPIGYSPLPINLVQASFDQINKLHDADPAVDLSNENVTTCNNPTFIAGQPTRNYLAEIAPQPAACDKTGAGPCTTTGSSGSSGTSGSSGSTSHGSTGSTGGTGSSGSHSSTGGSSGSGGTTGGTNGTTTGGTGGSTAASHTDPLTGQQVYGDAGDTGTGTGGDVQANPTELAGSQSSGSDVGLGILIGALLVGLLLAPPLVARRFAKGNG
jgi:ABC-type phosphate transport system substrate-binding protein